MSLYDVLDQVIELLKRRGRVTYRAIKREFNLDDDFIEDLKEELLFSGHPVSDEDGRGLVWTEPMVDPTLPAQERTTSVEPYTPDAERRQLTVMFVDMVDSTRLSGELDPEDFRDIVCSYQSACTEVIQRYEGYIAQLLGDGLLVYFGYPQAHEDDARRAIYAGLGIVEAINLLNDHLEKAKDIRLAVRLGIHTGLVVVGEMGGENRQEQLALGETPNIAARIQGFAQPNTLVVSESTYRLVRGFFDCAPLGEQSLRGVSECLSVYRAISESGIHSRIDAAGARGLTPIVGRHSERQLLIDRWTQTRSGEGQVILINAEPGLGKSRMVQALREHLADEAYTRLECRSSPYYQNTALYPVIDLIQRILGWQPGEAEDEKLNTLKRALSQYRLPIEETIPLMAGLLSLTLPEDRYPALNVTPQRQRQKTLEAIVAMVMELAQREPVLFILEDLHWTDPSTIELLGLLIEQAPTSRLFVLLTCRPEFESPYGNRTYLTQMTLNRLSQHDMEQIVDRLTAGKPVPRDILQQIIEKTDGVPLFIEEMTKSVLESGLLKETAEGYELVDTVSSLATPATLQDSLMARLDHLMTAKGVAQLAAVIGRQFSYDLLRNIAQLDETTLQGELGRLVESELVYQRGVLPDATYIFKHALIQDTAYESLLRRTRQQYHQRIAQVLEATFPDTAETQPELVAHHYTEAGLIEPAIDYWQRAGKRASERFAYQEAINHLTTGLNLLGTLPETLERSQQELALQTALGSALLMIRGQAAPEVEIAYTRAHTLCQQLGDTKYAVLVLLGLWRFHVVRAEYHLARQLGEELLDLAQQREEAPIDVLAHYTLGFTDFCLGELRTARHHLEEGVARYTPSQRRYPTFQAGQNPGVACHVYAAWTLWLLGYPDQAITHMHDALALAAGLNHPFTYSFARLAAALLGQLRQETQEIADHAEADVHFSTEQGFPMWLAIHMFLQGWAMTTLDQPKRGVIQMHKGLADWRTCSAEFFVPYFLALLAEGHGTTVQPKEGLTVLREAFSLVDNNGERWYEAELYRLRGQLLLQQSADNVAEAVSCFHQAMTIAQSQSAKSLELRAATSLAQVWQCQGKRDEVHGLLAPLYDWFTEGFDTADLKHAKILLAEFVEGTG